MDRIYRTFPSVNEFYPEINQDLTKISWAHGVDKKKSLSEALRGIFNTFIIFKLYFKKIHVNS